RAEAADWPSSPAANRGDLAPQRGGDGNQDSIFTYSKSPGLLSMPTLGGAIHGANWPIAVTEAINEAMKSPSPVEGSQSSRRLVHVASSISTPSGVACTSLNSPIARWKATCGRLNL